MVFKTLSAVVSVICVTGAVAFAQGKIDECGRERVEKVEYPNVIWEPGVEGEQISLWPDNVGIEPPELDGNPEMVGTGSPLIAGRTWGFATYIAHPTMTIYRPKGENTGAAMLVVPGGGYAAVAMDLEGTEICDWITAHGVTCVVLKYRAPQTWVRNENGVGQPPEKLLPLEDAERAMSLLRRDAAHYGIDPDKIGVIGFSAGAHLVAAISNADERSYSPLDGADKMPTRPNFAIVAYPGRFLPTRDETTDLTLAPWMHISEKAPPTLLIHAMNDRVNDVRHSMAYALALRNVGVPVDLRIFAKGCHAFGVRPTDDPITTQWPDHAIDWMKSIGMI
jgi:acetyl esterase/lipase